MHSRRTTGTTQDSPPSDAAVHRAMPAAVTRVMEHTGCGLEQQAGVAGWDGRFVWQVCVAGLCGRFVWQVGRQGGVRNRRTPGSALGTGVTPLASTPVGWEGSPRGDPFVACHIDLSSPCQIGMMPQTRIS
jgi:hypothetical protein